jgi:transcriptional regulator GlxA family with amidase domain
VVAQAEAYLRANLDGRVRLTELCRIVGLSERGLRNAFYRVHGVSPTRWIMGERLQGVRNALIDDGVTSTTVTTVAAEYGFYELGRFAAIYKDAFGEAPSDTLRSNSRRSTLTDYRNRTRRCSPEYVR